MVRNPLRIQAMYCSSFFPGLGSRYVMDDANVPVSDYIKHN